MKAKMEFDTPELKQAYDDMIAFQNYPQNIGMLVIQMAA